LSSVQGALSAQTNFLAPVTGTYTVVVANFIVGSADGSYLLQVSGPVAGAGPTTVNDTYATNFDTPLVIATPGILSNDNSNGGGPITAALVTTATNGTVTLNANGSFTYTPSASFVGTATFTYRAINAVANGNVATVAITVNALPGPTTVHDAFATSTDVSLVVPAPGVLINDNSKAASRWRPSWSRA
jgi:VCBS repeat-containing protein